MAFVDKTTLMRRVAIIGNTLKGYSGNVEYEGVEIDDNLILKEVDSYATTIVNVKKDEIEDWLEHLSPPLIKDAYILVYLDEPDEYIEVRAVYENQNQKYFDLIHLLKTKIEIITNSSISDDEIYENFAIEPLYDENDEIINIIIWNTEYVQIEQLDENVNKFEEIDIASIGFSNLVNEKLNEIFKEEQLIELLEDCQLDYEKIVFVEED